jgi:hypothetical protein
MIRQGFGQDRTLELRKSARNEQHANFSCSLITIILPVFGPELRYNLRLLNGH